MGPTHDRFGPMKTVHQTVVLWLTYRVYEALEYDARHLSLLFVLCFSLLLTTKLTSHGVYGVT